MGAELSDTECLFPSYQLFRWKRPDQKNLPRSDDKVSIPDVTRGSSSEKILRRI